MNVSKAEDRYVIDDPAALLSPSLVVFKQRVQANIAEVIRIAGGVDRLRPHCKTHKMPAMVELLLAEGIDKHKAATFAEAEMLADAGVRDVLLAYNLVGPAIGRAVAFVQRYPVVTFGVTADHPAAVRQLGEAMARGGCQIDVLLDINPGRDRTGLPPGDAARELYALLGDTPGIRPGGFHIYDGHQHQRDVEERAAAVRSEWESIINLRDTLVADGLPVPRLVCGGTPTFPVYARFDDPTIELSPGTCLFHDLGYGEKFPDLQCFQPAALLLTRVISRPTATRITLDLGTKAVASDPPMGQRVHFPALPGAKQVLHNEEHLVLELDEASANDYVPGDVLLGIPRHVCPCSALYQQAYVIESGRLVDTWPVVARDRVLTI